MELQGERWQELELVFGSRCIKGGFGKHQTFKALHVR